MSDLDAIDYKYGQKNHWRRQVWNQIREWTPRHPKDSVVLYLAGDADLDRPVAISKGFKPANLIAVERDRKVVQSLRQRRVTVIPENLVDVLDEWPTSPNIDVLFADLVSGFDREAMAAMWSWVGSPVFNRSVLALNVMAGREQSANSRFVREAMCNPSSIPDDLNIVKGHPGIVDGHRGIAAHFWLWLALGALIDPSDSGRVVNDIRDSGVKLWDVRLLPRYISTSGQAFDTILVRDRGEITKRTHRINQTVPATKKQLRVRRRIASALALRTQRLRGSMAGE